MMTLIESEKTEIRLLNAGQPPPEQLRYRLFPNGQRTQEAGKEYRLVNEGKHKQEEVRQFALTFGRCILFAGLSESFIKRSVSSRRNVPMCKWRKTGTPAMVLFSSARH